MNSGSSNSSGRKSNAASTQSEKEKQQQQQHHDVHHHHNLWKKQKHLKKMQQQHPWRLLLIASLCLVVGVQLYESMTETAQNPYFYNYYHTTLPSSSSSSTGQHRSLRLPSSLSTVTTTTTTTTTTTSSVSHNSSSSIHNNTNTNRISDQKEEKVKHTQNDAEENARASLESVAAAAQPLIPNQQQQQQLLQPQQQLKRVLMAIVSYDMTQAHYLEQLLEQVLDMCASTIETVDVVLYTSVVWPTSYVQNWQRLLLGQSCGNLEIIWKSPDWGHLFVNFHRQLFYDRLHDYDLFVYTEDDLLIQPRHVHGYWREMQQLIERVGYKTTKPWKTAGDYAVGFLRYEWQHGDPNTKMMHAAPNSTATSTTATTPSRDMNRKLIWEHHWNLTSVDAFKNRHLVNVPTVGGNNELHYFTAPGYQHQGMYMALPMQLEVWRDRRPCQFQESPWMTKMHLHRERVSSLQLFSNPRSDMGCGVKQIIPIDRYQDFLVQHLSNKQHKSMWLFINMTVSQAELHDILQQVQHNLSLPTSSSSPPSSSRLIMYNGEWNETNPERRKDDFDPNLTEYHQVFPAAF